MQEIDRQRPSATQIREGAPDRSQVRPHKRACPSPIGKLTEATELGDLIFVDALAEIKREMRANRRMANALLLLALAVLGTAFASVAVTVFKDARLGGFEFDVLGYTLLRVPYGALLVIPGVMLFSWYRWVMNKITHAQDELVTIDSWKAAAINAARTGDVSLLKQVIRQEMLTDRNRLLHRRETTVEFERTRGPLDRVMRFFGRRRRSVRHRPTLGSPSAPGIARQRLADQGDSSQEKRRAGAGRP